MLHTYYCNRHCYYYSKSKIFGTSQNFKERDNFQTCKALLSSGTTTKRKWPLTKVELIFVIMTTTSTNIREFLVKRRRRRWQLTRRKLNDENVRQKWRRQKHIY